eukprot:scaffold8.g1365.t1
MKRPQWLIFWQSASHAPAPFPPYERSHDQEALLRGYSLLDAAKEHLAALGGSCSAERAVSGAANMAATSAAAASAPLSSAVQWREWVLPALCFLGGFEALDSIGLNIICLLAYSQLILGELLRCAHPGLVVESNRAALPGLVMESNSPVRLHYQTRLWARAGNAGVIQTALAELPDNGLPAPVGMTHLWRLQRATCTAAAWRRPQRCVARTTGPLDLVDSYYRCYWTFGSLPSLSTVAGLVDRATAARQACKAALPSYMVQDLRFGHNRGTVVWMWRVLSDHQALGLQAWRLDILQRRPLPGPPVNMPSTTHDNEFCTACGKGATELKTCARCKQVMYWSKACQLEHFKAHRAEYKAVAALSVAAGAGSSSSSG